jgi:hypothetical protein
MNFLELQAHVKQQANAVAHLYPKYKGEEKPRWQLERDEMQEHYEGKVPKALLDAFPNEEAKILEYRKKVGQPLTRGVLMKAIDEIWRLFSGSRYSVEIANKDFEKWVNAPNWDGMNLIQWIIRVGYACRVVDANGYIVLIPKGEGLKNPKVRVEVDFEMVSSYSIVEEGSTVLAWKEEVSKEHSQLGKTSPTYYMTDEVFAVAKPNPGREMELELLYNHKAGRIPGVKLGGRTVIEMEEGKPKRRELSDFVHALALMNGLQLLDNQYISVTLSSCFPHRFIQGVPCKTCSGTGLQSHLLENGEQVTSTCETCKGAKQTFPVSPLLGYFINPAPPGVTPEERSAMAERKPIEFAQPDISTIQFLAERRDKLKIELDQALDIHRQQNFAQSGVSKEQDRQGGYIQIQRIAEYWFNVMLKSVLEFAQIYFEPLESKRGSISVSAPVSFDIKNETDLLAEFVSMFTSAPAIIRYPAFNDYIKKRFSNDAPLARAASLAVQYAPLAIANENEKRGQPEVELAKATYAMPMLLQLMQETKGFVNEKQELLSDDEVLAKLGEKIAPYLVPQPAPGSGALFNDLNV